MFRNYRFVRNLLYLSKGIKEIGDSKDKIFFKCLKCKSKLEGFKNYGKLNIICTCGKIVSIYTGKDIRFKTNKDENEKSKLRNKIKKIESETEQRLKNFENYVEPDLKFLYDFITIKRDITKQVKYEECELLVSDVDGTEKYDDVVEHLQHFCEIDSASIKIVWKPLYHQNKLIKTESNLHIIGTTYFMPLGSFIYYSIYLNPEFTWNHKLMVTTIAHEMSHIYASFNNILFESLDTERGVLEIQEQMTDLLGIVLGMGELMYNDTQGPNEIFNTC